MAQLLHHQESGLFYGKEMQGRRWSFLQFFGLRRRPRSMKMLSDKKHGQEKGTSGSRLRGSYVPLKDEDNGATDDHENTQVTHKQKGSRRKSGKAGLRSFISRKLYGKEGQKEKMLPVAPRLLRTLSIHYLESNVYVFDSKLAANGGASSHGAESSLQNATGTNLQHNTLDGSGSDTRFSQLPGEEHVKRKSHRSISMDGVLHKVPYGQKVSGDTILQELPRSASATYDRDCLKPHTGTSARRHINHGFGRSRSLSESLESYSHLLDSISSSEAKRVLTSSKSTRNHSLESKGLTRLAEYLVIPEDAFAAQTPDVKIAVDGDVKIIVDESSCNKAAGVSDNPVLPEEYSNDENRGVAASVHSEVVDVSEEHAAETCDDEQVLSSTQISDIPEEHAEFVDDDLIHSSTAPDSCILLSLVQSEDIDIAEQHATPPDDQIQSCTTQPSEDIDTAEEDAVISDNCQVQSFEATCCVPDPNQDTEDGLHDSSCEKETESPTSVLDAAFSDHHASSEYDDTMLDDSSSLEEIAVYSNGADDSAGNDDVNVEENNFSDPSDLHLQAADPKNEAVLNYVKNIFNKSSFATEPLFDAWCSRNMASLHKEDCQHNDLNFSAASASDLAIADMCADELLLFDLTNEALLDMYKEYAARSRFYSFGLWPKPVGQRAISELWNRVSCQLEELPPSGVDVDSLLVSDLAKADRWMELRGDGDEVGSKVADFVLDRLLTELALQHVKF